MALVVGYPRDIEARLVRKGIEMRRNAVVLLVCLTACGGLIPELPKEAEQAAETVLIAVGDGDFATVWNEWTAPEFREKVPRESFEKLVAGLHRKLGPVRSKTQAGFHYKTGTGMPDATISYNVTWEKGQGLAVVRFFQIDGKWKLAHLNVNSPTLLE